MIDVGVIKVVSSIYSTALERSADNPNRRTLLQGLRNSPLENSRTHLESTLDIETGVGPKSK